MGMAERMAENKARIRILIIKLYVNNIGYAYSIKEICSGIESATESVVYSILMKLCRKSKLHRGKTFEIKKGRGRNRWYYFVPTEWEGEVMKWLESEIAKDTAEEEDATER